ncbi:MAG: hypothetical protein GZ094_02745 [Mariniphaga sp.]|nr:hypothetical protein [Mariniphaga sp.]
MIEIIKNAFVKGLRKRYDNIFEQYYPAHNSTGFTERNLTCHFAEALVIDLNDKAAFIWYEAPLPRPEKGKCPHIDAVVFSKTRNAVFFIEAKRLGDKPKGKIKAVAKDLKRLYSNEKVIDFKKENEFNNRDFILQKWHSKDITQSNQKVQQYVICIMDFWKNKSFSFGKVEELLIEMNKSFSPLVNEDFTEKIISFNIDPPLSEYSIFLTAFKIEDTTI